jgi:hypothetical protein
MQEFAKIIDFAGKHHKFGLYFGDANAGRLKRIGSTRV